MNSAASRSERVSSSILDACPDCGGRDFLYDEHFGDAVFSCLACAADWRYSLGYVWRVNAHN